MFKRVIAALLALFAAAAFAAVDVNKANSAELDSVKGIGPAIATKILDERKKGSFKDWTDFVDRVKGVGEGSAAKLSAEGLTVNGQSFSGAAAPAKTPMKAAVKPEPDVAAAKPAKADKATKAKADDKAAAPAAADKASAPTKADKKAEKAEKAAAKKAEKAAAKADAASAAKK